MNAALRRIVNKVGNRKLVNIILLHYGHTHFMYAASNFFKTVLL